MDRIEEMPPMRRRTVTRGTLGMIAALFLWSFLAGARPSTGDEQEVVEPAGLAAYATFADARAVQTYFDHQTYQIPLGPSLARSLSEVSLPSTGSGTGWLVDGGLANGLHGTTTGSRVPTEASAKQPGGDQRAEFRVAGGPIGDDPFMRAGAGVAGAEARHTGSPRGFAHSHLDNLVVLPAAGSPEHPPGTFNPDQTHPGGEEGRPVPDRQPQGQMALLSIGSIASTAESVRNGETVTSVAVAEVNEINIGNRTSDNRCTNCIRIDSLRAEAFAEANGQPGGSRGRYRVVVGRACRRALDANTQTEKDTCIRPSENVQTIAGPAEESQSIERFEDFNRMFERPIWTMVPGLQNTMVGIRIHAGTPHDDADRAKRTSDPPEEVRRNYGYPDARLNSKCATNPDCAGKFEGFPEEGGEDRERRPVTPRHQEAADRDAGTLAKAVAEALDIEIWTVTLSQAVPSDEKVRELAPDLVRRIDEDRRRPGIQMTVPNPECAEGDPCVDPIGADVGPARVQPWPVGQVTISTEAVRTIRRANLTLGVATASATARPAEVVAGPPGAVPGTGGRTGDPAVPGGSSGSPSFGVPPLGRDAPAAPGTVVVRDGIRGPLKIRFDWSQFKLQPWPPGDMAKGLLAGAIIGGAVTLGRRRLRRLGSPRPE